MNLLFVLCTLFSALVAGLSVVDQRATDTTLVPRQDTLAFTSAKWIWTSTIGGPHAFRRDFTPPLGKALVGAEIIAAVLNGMSIWVNGELIGTNTIKTWAVRYCQSDRGGVYCQILLTYSDGTTDTIVSDATWLASSTVPAGFQEQSFDDTAWIPATVIGAYGDAAFGAPEIPSNPPSVSFTGVPWIWTNDVPASGDVPIVSRAFRRTYLPAAIGVPASADIIITADNEYTLWVNGVEIGSGTNWKIAQHYIVNLAPASELVLAVLANNTAVSVAGLLVALEVNMVVGGRNNCTAGIYGNTDGAWVSTMDEIPAGWQLPGFDDSPWPKVSPAEGFYPTATPWKTVTIAAASTPVNAF
ncbi:hypothetical protein C8R45DRAFT_1101455 [Mycena sanguinolenta]|nr:hypothetical protein C8R45DRAFT_1101455 [Mycena sanguinolenta]